MPRGVLYILYCAILYRVLYIVIVVVILRRFFFCLSRVWCKHFDPVIIIIIITQMAHLAGIYYYYYRSVAAAPASAVDHLLHLAKSFVHTRMNRFTYILYIFFLPFLAHFTIYIIYTIYMRIIWSSAGTKMHPARAFVPFIVRGRHTFRGGPPVTDGENRRIGTYNNVL